MTASINVDTNFKKEDVINQNKNKMKKYLEILRPTHWIKNIFLYVGLIFGGKLSGSFEQVLSAVGLASVGFICFCLASSSVYIFNDIIDRRSDKFHPQKSKRPIASGQVSVISAAGIAIICLILSLTISLVMSYMFTAIISSYMVLVILYSVILKRIMILDCIVISTGFCLRAIAGAVIVEVPISHWLIICTFALCLFVAFSKRRGEVQQLQDDSESFRETLGEYTPELLAHMLDVTSVIAIICFLLYAMDERTVSIFGTNKLIYTTPIVLYCTFRFSALIQTGKFVGPVELILKDRPFQLGFIFWVISCILIIYDGFSNLNSLE